MRSLCAALLVASLLALLLALPAAAAGWSKFLAADMSFSFHYPSGWTAVASGSVIEVNSPQGEEQLLLIALPFERTKTPRQLTETMLGLLRRQAPNLQASGWSEGGGGSSIVAEFAYADKGRDFRGELLTVKGSDSAMWFSYLAPAAGYSRARALALLQGLTGSLTTGTGSLPPGAPPPSRLEDTARAFIFVLEFSLGCPFTAQQERLVLDQLLDGWSRASAAELKPYEAYPGYVKAILRLNQKQVAAMQQELQKTTREWLETSPQEDPAVAMIQAQLAMKGRALVAGTPPLTLMAARAYSELMAYAELLQREPAATPGQVPAAEIEAIRAALITQWPKLSTQQREQVAGTPGLWMVLRTQLDQGTAEDRQEVRRMLAKLAPAPSGGGQPAGGAKPAAGTSAKPSGGASPADLMLRHNVLMNIQQQTFNHWQWCMGYKSTPFGF